MIAEVGVKGVAYNARHGRICPYFARRDSSLNRFKICSLFFFFKWIWAETRSVGVWQRQGSFQAVAFNQKGKELILKSVSCLRRNDIPLDT